MRTCHASSSRLRGACSRSRLPLVSGASVRPSSGAGVKSAAVATITLRGRTGIEGPWRSSLRLKLVRGGIPVSFSVCAVWGDPPTLSPDATQLPEAASRRNDDAPGAEPESSGVWKRVGQSAGAGGRRRVEQRRVGNRFGTVYYRVTLRQGRAASYGRRTSSRSSGASRGARAPRGRRGASRSHRRCYAIGREVAPFRAGSGVRRGARAGRSKLCSARDDCAASDRDHQGHDHGFEDRHDPEARAAGRHGPVHPDQPRREGPHVQARSRTTWNGNADRIHQGSQAERAEHPHLLPRLPRQASVSRPVFPPTGRSRA